VDHGLKIYFRVIQTIAATILSLTFWFRHNEIWTWLLKVWEGVYHNFDLVVFITLQNLTHLCFKIYSCN